MLLRNCISITCKRIRKKGTRTPKAMSLNESELYVYIYICNVLVSQLRSLCWIKLTTQKFGYSWTN